MDEELKEEFKKINKGLSKLNTRIDKLEEAASKSTMAAVGFSLVLAGLVLQLQQNAWSPPSVLFISLGFILASWPSVRGKRRFMRWMKWFRIAFWTALGIAVGLTIYVVAVVLST